MATGRGKGSDKGKPTERSAGDDPCNIGDNSITGQLSSPGDKQRVYEEWERGVAGIRRDPKAWEQIGATPPLEERLDEGVGGATVIFPSLPEKREKGKTSRWRGGKYIAAAVLGIGVVAVAGWYVLRHGNTQREQVNAVGDREPSRTTPVNPLPPPTQLLSPASPSGSPEAEIAQPQLSVTENETTETTPASTSLSVWQQLPSPPSADAAPSGNRYLVEYNEVVRLLRTESLESVNLGLRKLGKLARELEGAPTLSTDGELRDIHTRLKNYTYYRYECVAPTYMTEAERIGALLSALAQCEHDDPQGWKVRTDFAVKLPETEACKENAKARYGGKGDLPPVKTRGHCTKYEVNPYTGVERVVADNIPPERVSTRLETQALEFVIQNQTYVTGQRTRFQEAKRLVREGKEEEGAAIIAGVGRELSSGQYASIVGVAALREEVRGYSYQRREEWTLWKKALSERTFWTNNVKPIEKRRFRILDYELTKEVYPANPEKTRVVSSTLPEGMRSEDYRHGRLYYFSLPRGESPELRPW